MKELMIHIERIVRPVRANQSRKLRMRRELLTHLQAALEEERANISDEAVAIAHVKERLGDPEELTAELQRSVPVIERIMHARTPDKVNGWEKHVVKRLGLYAPATFAHWLILNGAGAIALVIVWAFSPRVQPNMMVRFLMNSVDHPEKARTVLIMLWLVQTIWAVLAMRFLAAAAAPGARFRLSRVIGGGLLTLFAQGLLLYLIISQMASRTPTFTEMTQSLGVGLLLAFACILVGRGVAVLRRPYDEWLMLDLSQ